MRIQVTVIVGLNDLQLEAYATAHALPRPIRAKDVVDDVRDRVLAAVRDSTAFGETISEQGRHRADVSLTQWRIPVSTVVELDDGQLEAYAAAHALPRPIRAKDVVDDVRDRVLATVRDSAAFGAPDDGPGSRRADVSLKR
jgi:hypothetical protein